MGFKSRKIPVIKKYYNKTSIVKLLFEIIKLYFENNEERIS